MIVKKYENEEEWLQDRFGRVTGTKLKDITPKVRGEGKKIGFYALIAERLCVPEDPENPMARGRRLEEECAQRFVIETGRDVNTDLVMWMREDNENIAYSPDGTVSETEAIECKSLNSAAHIEAYLTQEIPDEYKFQALQPFIVNDKLQKLFFCFFDPRIPCKDFFIIEVLRDQARVIEYLEIERKTLFEIDSIVEKLKN